MRVGMKPKCRGGLIDLQHWPPAFARLNELLRPAVIVTGHQKPVPVHRRGGIEMVLHDHFDFIAATHADNRAQDWCRVAICSCRLSFDKSMLSGRRYQVDGVSRCRGVDQLRNRQRSRKGCGLPISRPAVKDGACCNRCAADHKPTARRRHKHALLRAAHACWTLALKQGECTAKCKVAVVFRQPGYGTIGGGRNLSPGREEKMTPSPATPPPNQPARKKKCSSHDVLRLHLRRFGDNAAP